MSFLKGATEKILRRVVLEQQATAARAKNLAEQTRGFAVFERQPGEGEAAALEAVQELLGGNDFLILDGILKTYDDAANTLALALDAEKIQDLINAALTQGAGIKIEYTDALNTIKISRSNSEVRTVTGSAAALETDLLLRVDASGSSAATITLADAATNKSAEINVKKIDSSVNPVTIQAQPGQLIDGAASKTISAQYQNLKLVSDGANWNVI